MQVSDAYPGARFRLVSEPLAYKPTIPVQEGEGFLSGMYWRGYETRVLEYENTNERTLCYLPQDATVDRDTTFQIAGIRSTAELDRTIVTVAVEQTGATSTTPRS